MINTTQLYYIVYHIPFYVFLDWPSKSFVHGFRYLTSAISFQETFTSSRTPQTESAPREATGEEKAEAEQLKNEGNQLMRDEKYTEALDCYTK